MKKIITYLVVLIITFWLGFMFYSYSLSGIAESKVLDLTNKLHKAEQNKEEENLNQILANEISYSRYDDQRIISKRQFIEDLKNNEFEIRSIEALSISTKVEKNQVRVYFEMKLKFIGEDQKTLDHIGDYTYTFEKQQDEWKLTAIHFEN